MTFPLKREGEFSLTRFCLTGAPSTTI
jgi:hypothetical protein